MINTVIEAVAFVIVLLGALALSCVAALLIITPRCRGRFVVILPCGQDEHDCARMLYTAHMRLALLAGCCKAGIIAVDSGMSVEERKICEAVCREYTNMTLCTPQELAKIISEDTT